MKWPWARAEQKSATSMIALSQLPGAAWGRQDAAALIRDGFCGNAIVYRCVRMIAEAAASIPLVSGDTDVARLLKAPSPDQAGRNLLEQLYADLQMTGNAWAEAVALGDDPAPRAIFALRADSVRTMSDARGHASGVAVRTARGERIIAREADGWSRVLHLKLYNPTDPHAGFAPLAAARKALDLHNGAAGWAKALIDNAARPSGALIYGKDGGQLTDEQFVRLKSDLGDLHALISFFEARQGRLFGFRFRDPMDHASAASGTAISHDDQVLGTGDDVQATFQLSKDYGGVVRPIVRPVNSSVRVGLNGLEQASGWALTLLRARAWQYSMAVGNCWCNQQVAGNVWPIVMPSSLMRIVGNYVACCAAWQGRRFLQPCQAHWLC